MNIDETNFLLCDLLPCVLSQFPFSIYSFFLSSSRVYVHIYIYMYSYIQVELVNVHKFVYIKTCIVHDTSSSKTTGTFVVNIAEISLTFSLFLSLSLSFSLSPLFVIFSSNVTQLVEREKEAERMEKKKERNRGKQNLFPFDMYMY